MKPTERGIGASSLGTFLVNRLLSSLYSFASGYEPRCDDTETLGHILKRSGMLPSQVKSQSCRFPEES